MDATDEEAKFLRGLEAKGLLYASAVVKAAKPKRSPIHHRFDWDDTTAADSWRLEQARKLIVSVRVEITTPEQHTFVVHGYTSLSADRQNGGGFRWTPKVLTTAEQRQDMVHTALAEFRVLKIKYAHLKELAGIFGEIDKL
jgi:hypothetical protein